MDTDKTVRIRALNDRLRCEGRGGTVMVTSGVASFGAEFARQALRVIGACSAFDDANDPYHEHDFGAVCVRDQKLLWTIDYYDQTLTLGAEDASDERSCRRVMTIMLAREY